MGMLDSIFEKLGLADPSAPPVAQAPRAEASQMPIQSQAGHSAGAADPTLPIRARASAGDVVAELNRRAIGEKAALNWKTSIVDLLKLLDLDYDAAARMMLGKELDCPQAMLDASKAGPTAAMNLWLHQALLQKLADNGGQVPAELLRKD